MAVDANEYIPTYKIVLLGEVNAGKTTLFHHLKEGRPVSRERHGPGVDYCTKTYIVDTETIKIVLWDTAGVERFRTLTRNYFRGACAVLFAYSTTNKDTLFNLVHFVEDAEECAPNALRYLVGCKYDMPSDKSLCHDDAKKFAEAHDCKQVFMTSAKTGFGIDEAFTEIAIDMHRLYKSRRSRFVESDSGKSNNFGLHSEAERKHDICAC